MSLPILQTKLYAPRPQRQKNLVPRPYLAEKLISGLAGKVTLISAPAGFGKSTLLSEWIAETRTKIEAPPAISHQVTWLTLDQDDNDPVRFLMYLIASLRKFDNTLGEIAWNLLQSPQPPAPKTILTLLINDLNQLDDGASPMRVRYVLVLEDYHVITAQPIHEALTYLIDNAPRHTHVVITTRADPPLPLPRWRGRDQLSEIRATDLRFTPDEATAFLNDRMGLNLSVDNIMALEVRTEGWIVGLQLVALSLQGHANKADFLQTFSGGHRYVLNYLVEEVLNQQPKAVQSFLLRTSILDHLCGPLCDAVIGDWSFTAAESVVGAPLTQAQAPNTHDAAQAMLEQLYQANLFTIPLDDKGEWYRYHQLFAEVLQHRLRQTQPEAWPLLHGRASVWYEQQGLLADAIHYALRAADFARMAQLVEQIWPASWNQGAVITLLHWVHLLPSPVLYAHPNLAISYAWALALAGQIEAAESGLQQVEAMLQMVDPEADAPPPVRNLLLGRIAALRAMMAARKSEPLSAVQLAQLALNLIPPDTAQERGNACYALGLAHQQNGALTDALRAYQEATRLGLMAGDRFLTIAARYHEGRTWMAQGRLRMAAHTYQQILAVAAQRESPTPVVGLAHVGYAEILYQWNDLATAAQQVETGLALSPIGSLTYTDGPLHRFFTLARIRQATGDQAGALAAVQLATETARQTGIPLDELRALTLAALMHLRLGRGALAAQWANSYTHWLKDKTNFAYIHEFETLVFMRILLAQARAEELLELLARWLPVAEAAEQLGSVIEMGMLQALALRLSGQSAAARRTIGRILALAQPEGYIRLFVDEGAPMQGLIVEYKAQIASSRPSTYWSAYLDQLLAAFEKPSPTAGKLAAAPAGRQGLIEADPASSRQKAQVVDLVEPLTSRELEVLRLMADGLSNSAIAQQLVVSVGTVKSHLKHIYSKLGVESRTQAVAQARNLSLL
jgi:LuxR family maltose regulon positive regulatory protein